MDCVHRRASGNEFKMADDLESQSLTSEALLGVLHLE